MSAIRARATVLVLVLSVLAFAVGALAASASAADVHGDDQGDRYVGTGGLLLPGSVDESVRQEVAGCDGCAWRMSTPCVLSVAGVPFDGQSGCTSVVRGCPGGDQLLRTWFHAEGEAWRDVGLVCVGSGGPVTVAELGGRAQEQVAARVPGLGLAVQPTRGAVTQLPVVFDSGQPAGPQSWRLEVLGQQLDLVATPEWTWSFGDGATLRTADPGGRYPHLAVAHAYRRSGLHRVEVATTWSATFTVDGLGPFPVAEEVGQRQGLDLVVGQGRALLAPGALPPHRPVQAHGTMRSNHGP